MDHTVSFEGGNATVAFEGNFTFADNQAFRKLLNEIIANEPNHVDLNLSSVEYIDSSGLGMMLLLRETLNEKEIGLTLIEPRGQVANLFEISNFDELFTIQK